MTGNKVQVLIEKFGKEIPPNMLFEFKNKLLEAEDKEFDVIYKCPIKKSVATILFSVFLGGLGIDRFYIGDYSLGVGKLVVNVLTTLLFSLSLYSGALWLIIVTAILKIACSVWLIVEMFISYKKCRYKNLVVLLHVLLDRNGRDLDDRILEIKAS